MRIPDSGQGFRQWALAFPLALTLCLALAFVPGFMSGRAKGAASPSTPQVVRFTLQARELGQFEGSPPQVTSPAAILVERQTGRVLYEHNSDVRRPMASTTKIMTAVLILENMRLENRVLVSADAAATPEPSPWLRAGDVLTVEQLLYALLLRSSNSAAVALAEACSGDVAAFVAEMNDKAAELGLTSTHFTNPHGLDEQGHYSTAADLARLACYALRNEVFRRIVDTESYTLRLSDRKSPIVFESTNKLLTEVDWVDGVKTGLTPKADQCLVGSGTKDGVSVVSVVLGQPSSAVCWAESRKLLEYGFTQYRALPIVRRGQAVARADLPYSLGEVVELVAAEDVDVCLYKDDTLTCTIEIERPFQLPVEAGTKFGVLRAETGGVVVGQTELMVARSYGSVSLGDKIAYYWGRLGEAMGRVF